MSEVMRGMVALITGAGTGIGVAIARRFARSGASVVVTGRRPELTHRIAEETGGMSISGDTSDPAMYVAAVQAAKERFGGLDILVSNAGIVRPGNVLTETDADWRDTLETNLNGVRQMARAAIPAMLERGAGAIVIISSIAGVTGFPGIASYVASKTAVIGLTRSMAVDFGPRNIRVNAVCPGWVRTPMAEEEMAALAAERKISIAEAWHLCTRYYPLGRMAEPDEVAAYVEFLASSASSFVTGVALCVDGGGSAVDVGSLPFQPSRMETNP